MLQGKDNGEKTYRFLYSVYGNPYGVSALMGNLHALSGLDPKSLNATCAKRLRESGKPYCTDQSYTDAIDQDIITKAEFLNPIPGKRYGYGIAQWSDENRKSGLYDLAKSSGTSIGDLETQLNYLVEELKSSYKVVHNALIKARNIQSASDMIVAKFLCLTNQSDTVKKQRAEYGHMFLDTYSKLDVSAPVQTDNPAVVEASAKVTEEFAVGDKVIVNGKIFGNGSGTGSCVEKTDATMYIIAMVNSSRYEYYIGLSNTPSGLRQGWTNPRYLRKIGSATPKAYSTVEAKAKPRSSLASLAGKYTTTGSLRIRNDAGTGSDPMITIPQGHQVICTDGQYTSYAGTKWLYVETIYRDVKYVGFCASNYLLKV